MTDNHFSSSLSRYREARRRLLESGGEPDEDILIEAIHGTSDLHRAIMAAVCSALEDEAAASRLRGRLDEMEARLRRIERRAEGKREFVLLAMGEAGLDRLDGEGVSIAVRRSPPHLVITDEGEIPVAFREPQPARVNYVKVRDALTAGVDVPGAMLGDSEPYLSVRTA